MVWLLHSGCCDRLLIAGTVMYEVVQVFYFSITHDALSTIILKSFPVIKVKVVLVGYHLVVLQTWCWVSISYFLLDFPYYVLLSSILLCPSPNVIFVHSSYLIVLLTQLWRFISILQRTSFSRAFLESSCLLLLSWIFIFYLSMINFKHKNLPSIILAFMREAPTCPLSVHICAYFGALSICLYTLFSIVCSFSISLSVRFRMLVPYNTDGRQIFFQEDFPIISLWQLLAMME